MTRTSFRQILRLIFAVFSIYLLGDAFSRWDGFSYYAPFSEFLPSLALAFILWSIVAFLAAVLAWLLLIVLEQMFSTVRLHINSGHIILYSLFIGLCGFLAWKAKKLLWGDAQTAFQIKLAVFGCISLVSLGLTWLFRGQVEKWVAGINERITPLVWTFGVLLLFSFPVVALNMWIKGTDARLHNFAFSADSDRTKPNIVLVTFDALAAQEMSLYGYNRKTTPFIDAWARAATVFNRVEAASNFTASTTASLMTGKRVWTHQTYHIEGSKPVRSETENLPHVLKENGYFNIALVVNPFASVRILGVSDSFDMAPLASEFGYSPALFGWKFGVIDRLLYRAFGDKIRLHNWIIKNDFILSKVLNMISRNIYETSVPPRKTFERFLDIMDADIPQPFFAWIHLFPPHDPYLPPETFQGAFNSSQGMRAYKPQERFVEESYKYLFQYKPVPEDMEPAIRVMRDYYDEYVSYIDDSFKNFMNELNKRSIDNTVIVLSADHGESFDHGYLTHGGPFLYEQVTHVPLIIKMSGQNDGKRVDILAEQIDLPATILDLAHVPVPAWMEGRSLVPLMRGEDMPVRPAFSMNFEENRSLGHEIQKGSIAVWNGDYKLIHYLDRGESQLFNLKRDPEETENLFNRETETGQRLLNMLYKNLNQANLRIKGFR